MTTTTAPRGRRILSTVLIILTCITLLLSLLALWARNTLLDTDRFTAGVERNLDDPVVVDALGRYIGEQISTALVQPDRIESLLPDALERAVPYLTATLQGAIEQQTIKVVESDTGREVVVRAVRAAHAAAMQLLEGNPPDSGFVIVTDEEVKLNLIPVVSLVLERVQQLGVFDNIELPTIDASQTPEEQIALISDAIGRELKPTFAQLTVYQRDPDRVAKLGTAQQMLKLFRAVVWLLVAVTILLVVVTMWVSPDRRRAAIWLGVGAAATGLLASMIVRNVADAVPNLMTDPSARAAAAQVVGNIVGRLNRTFIFLTLAGGALVVAMAVLARSDWPSTKAKLQSLASSNPDGMRIGSIAIAIVVLLWLGLGWVSLVLAGLVVAGGFALVAGAAPRPSDSVASP